MRKEEKANQFGHTAILDFEGDDCSADVGNASKRKNPFVGDIERVLMGMQHDGLLPA